MCNMIAFPHVTPIDDVDGLNSFNSTKVSPDLISTLPWSMKSHSGPRTLLCHDMCGGYKDDRFVNGTDNPEFFNFYHWAQIDTFVYFSHHLVTIPPIMWTNQAHRNGVQVLGTFITEWEAGKEKCSLLFGSVEAAIQTATQLTEVARTYNFDGWLINIENTLTGEEIDNMKVFLQYLTIKMAEVNPHSSVIWYDAVTTEGELVWQNRVSDLNLPFLECCNGIFLNYTWLDWHLKLSSELSSERLTDVYTGIDVWARGCVGKFDTCMSTTKIREYGLSTAIFAPGWCYEQNSGDFDQFLKDTNRFWRLLEPSCRPYSDPVSLPYKTNFNYGAGKIEFEEGRVKEGEHRWFNLSLQDAPFVSFTDSDRCSVGICWEDAWQGSTSLSVQCGDEKMPRLIQLSVVGGGVLVLVCKALTGGLGALLLSEGEETTTVEIQHREDLGEGWSRLICSIPDDKPSFSWIGLRFTAETSTDLRIGEITVE